MSLLLIQMIPVAVQAQLEFLPDPPAAVVFGGKPQTIHVRIHRSSPPHAIVTNAERQEFKVGFRLFQESSGLAVPLGPVQPWKVLSILPGQTLLETVTVEFPSVKRSTDGVVRWETEDGSGLGSTRVRVVPTDLITELRTLTGGGSVGVVNASTAMTALFEGAGLAVEDLTDLPQRQEAHVIVVMPGELAETQPALLARRIRLWVESGRTVVWFKSDPSAWTSTLAERRPGQGSLVTVDAGMVERLDTAEAQWRLVNLVRWACRPTAME
ncbi:MAG: hypothetical protein KJ072_24260 [Verrucomicrobia bacterium]|nr:hypothetical protein [Verrucomicrobiota bacterium]